ncbi:MAE_28990/MAE_18760 family HEPN-like nuclease [Bradyrhizobium sp. HKCCYLS20291]|uniref:MAE_28990/MAE_18760 family HEPN-like nuclease n=1 Tax=Bradyrhizobium sp. HKCCYLS20291 TaxID=3420766 RepID=UPI003EBF13F9
MTRDEFVLTMADAVDRRRQEISLILRVVSNSHGSVLEQTASVMALPVLYAHWEGFVKEAVGEYIEFVERQRLIPSQAHPTIFSFAMKKQLRGLISSGSVERMTNFATWVISAAVAPVCFDDKSIVTGGNLSFKNLKELCDSLKIDVLRLDSDRRKIDALVNRRNNVAHTGRVQRFDRADVADDAALVIGLIETFEAILIECVDAKQYRLPELALDD